MQKGRSYAGSKLLALPSPSSPPSSSSFSSSSSCSASFSSLFLRLHSSLVRFSRFFHISYSPFSEQFREASHSALGVRRCFFPQSTAAIGGSIHRTAASGLLPSLSPSSFSSTRTSFSSPYSLYATRVFVCTSSFHSPSFSSFSSSICPPSLSSSSRYFFATFRHNICTDDWIAFPGRERKARPQQMRNTQVQRKSELPLWEPTCNFCIGNEGKLPETLKQYDSNDFVNQWPPISPEEAVVFDGGEEVVAKEKEGEEEEKQKGRRGGEKEREGSEETGKEKQEVGFIRGSAIGSSVETFGNWIDTNKESKKPLSEVTSPPFSSSSSSPSSPSSSSSVSPCSSSSSSSVSPSSSSSSSSVSTSSSLPYNASTSSASFPHLNPDRVLMRIIPNKFPVVSPSKCIIDPSLYPFCVEESMTECSQLVDCLTSARKRGGLQTTIEATGFHEVVVDVGKHNVRLRNLNNVYWQMLFTAFRDRCKVMVEAAPLIQTILCFKNEGAFGGASMCHPHSQLVGLPVVPQSQQKFHEIAREYFASYGHCLFCDYIQNETTEVSRQRVVEETADYIAVVPFAAHIPYHMTVFPKKHNYQFIDENDEALSNLGSILQKVFTRLDKLFPDPDYNLVLRNTHLHRGRLSLYRPDCFYHWHVEIFPRLDSWPVAGFEFGTGIMCNSHFPEEDAEALRTGKLKTTRIW